MLQATKHQGQSFFRGNGRQCVANSVQALLTSQQLSPSEWTTSTLDKILEDGDTLYCQIVPERNKYLKFEDLPSRIGDTTISLHESLCGTLTRDITNKPFYSIRDAINQLMSNDTTCLFTMGSYSLSYTCGIVKNAAKFYFFDPHSRADTGMVAADGVATMTIHKNVFDLSQFIKHLAASLGNADDTPFEMASVVVSKTQFEKVTFSNVLDSSSEGSDSFSGYSSESDGEIACRLYLKMEKENLQVENVATPDVSDANTSDLSNYSSSSFDDTSTCSSIESINTDTLEANLHDSFLQSFNDDVVDDIINESYSEQLSKNTDQEMHENVYEYSTIRLDDYADDYVNNDDERDKDYNPDDDDDDDDDDDAVYCNRNDDDSSDTLNFYQQKTQSSRAANINNTQNSHKMKDDDAYTLLVTKGDGNQDSQVTGNGTQSSQETKGNDRQCPQVNLLTTNDDATPSSLVNPEVANNDSQNSQVNSQVLNDIQSSLINSQVGNDSGSQVNEDGKTITLKRGRKRHRDVHNWKRNRTKKRCNEGKSYTTRKGNKKPARAMKPGCGHGCRNKCQGKFNESERHTIFHSYWQLGDIYKQRQFIAKFATIKVTGKNKLLSSSSRRKWTVSYSLPQRQADGSTKAVKVCKTFFHHTLGITDRTVSTVHKKLSAIGICMEDLRGRHNNRPNRATENQQSDIRKHIESFQPIESHYCRKDSGKQYLPANLTVSKMYEAYTENCPLSEVPASINVYRRIFNEEYNLSFHTPLKDQCDQCAAYRNASPELYFV